VVKAKSIEVNISIYSHLHGEDLAFSHVRGGGKHLSAHGMGWDSPDLP